MVSYLHLSFIIVSKAVVAQITYITHDDVIKIQRAHIARETTQYPFQKLHKCCRYIAEPERHQGELITATPPW